MKRRLVCAAAVAMTFLLSACGWHGCGPGAWGEGGWGPMMFPGGGMFVAMIVLAILVGVLVWWLTKGGGARDRGALPRESPIEILKRRYAAGEITKEQFDSMKKDLES